MCTTHFKALQLWFGNSTTTDFTLLYHMIVADWWCIRTWHGCVCRTFDLYAAICTQGLKGRGGKSVNLRAWKHDASQPHSRLCYNCKTNKNVPITSCQVSQQMGYFTMLAATCNSSLTHDVRSASTVSIWSSDGIHGSCSCNSSVRLR